MDIAIRSTAFPPAACCSQRAAEINDGDLIVVKENGAFALYLYLKDRKVKADGEKRILHNKSKAYAKVLGSFNFYH